MGGIDRPNLFFPGTDTPDVDTRFFETQGAFFETQGTTEQGLVQLK